MGFSPYGNRPGV